jgi:hypothetical protein
LTDRIFNVLNDPSGDPKQDKELIMSPGTTASGVKDGGTVIDTPSETPTAEIDDRWKSQGPLNAQNSKLCTKRPSLNNDEGRQKGRGKETISA